MTIKQKFVLCGLLVFVALGAIGLGTGVEIREAQRQQVQAGLGSSARLEASRVEDLLVSTSVRLTQATARLELSRALTEASATTAPVVERALLDLLETEPTLVAVSLLDPSGAVLADTSNAPSGRAPVEIDPAAFTAATTALEVGEPFSVGRAFRVRLADERYLHTIEIAASDGEAVGYLVSEFDLAPIQALFVDQDELGQTAEAHLVQQTAGGAQFITDLRFHDGARFELEVPDTQVTMPAIRALAGPPGTFDGVRDYRGQVVIASVRNLPRTPWGLVVKIDQAEAYAPLNRALSLGLAGFLGAGVLSIGALVVASSSVLRRIRRVADSASAISNGDLTARVSDLAPDELGSLSRAFDQMADNLVADMTRRRRIEAELAHRARHDMLTGLPNRMSIQHDLKTALLEARPGSIAVLFCDLDEFKTVNDDLGHSTGDVLLREVTHRLRRAVSGQNLLARFGGDEFIVVLRGLDDVDEAIAVAERVTDELSAPINLNGREVFVTTSVGVALNGPGSTAETLIRDADAAMYQAKALGRARVVVHDATIGARANNRLAMTTQLHLAIANGGLDVALQPIVDLATEEVYAFEVLVRWRHEGREIDPSEFVMRATELDLAGALDRWVLETACRLVSQLRGSTTTTRGWLHVNVTGTSLIDEEFATDVLAVLAEHRVRPSELCLEIVEDRLGGAPQHALATLAKLREAGVRVAIDDFGTGHSSLARLRDLPADTVKIDQSFLRHLDGDQTSLAITRAIISLADQLGLEVVAEGVEGASHSSTLLSLGCRYGQGFFLGKPRRADDVVADHRARRASLAGTTSVPTEAGFAAR